MPIKTAVLPPAEELHSLFKYNPETGSLIWKERELVVTREDKIHNVRNAGRQVGALNSCGHRQVRVGGRLIVVHRIIWKMMTGNEVENQIDHINGHPDDNRWENLREAEPPQNCWNRKINSNNTSGHPCVYMLNRKRASSKKFRMKMGFRGKMYVKDFDTVEEAKAAYETAFAICRDISFKRDTT
jgi:hypothetical protein